MIRQLNKKDNLGDFDCGDGQINSWFQQRAKQWQRKSLTVVYVMERDNRIVGFYSLAAGSLDPDDNNPTDIQKGLPRNLLVPIILIGQLGADHRTRGQGTGSELLGDAFRRCWQLSRNVGVRAVVVHPRPGLHEYYHRFGFVEFGLPHILALHVDELKPYATR